jgi:hypothetical protein
MKHNERFESDHYAEDVERKEEVMEEEDEEEDQSLDGNDQELDYGELAQVEDRYDEDAGDDVNDVDADADDADDADADDADDINADDADDIDIDLLLSEASASLERSKREREAEDDELSVDFFSPTKKSKKKNKKKSLRGLTYKKRAKILIEERYRCSCSCGQEVDGGQATHCRGPNSCANIVNRACNKDWLCEECQL